MELYEAQNGSFPDVLDEFVHVVIAGAVPGRINNAVSDGIRLIPFFDQLDVEFVEKETDNSSMYFAIGVIGGFLVISGLAILLVMRRRRRLADLDLIDSL